MTAQDALGFLKTKSPKYLADWLTDALIGYYGEGNSDAFYPHLSFVSNGDPLYTISQVYKKSSASVQSRLRSAVAASSVLGLVGVSLARLGEYNLEKRLQLLSVVCTLVSETGCVDGVPRLTDSATVYLDKWGSEEQQNRAFALVLRSVTDLSISSRHHSNLTGLALRPLESNLMRLICSVGFRPQYSPRCAHALLQLNPGAFFEYYDEVLGMHIQDFHAHDKDEEAHAFATADKIAEHSKIELMQFSSRLQVTGSRPRDLWLLNAWNRPSSKFHLFRKGSDPNKLYLTLRQQSGQNSRVPIVLRNPNFYELDIKSELRNIVSEHFARNSIASAAIESMNSILHP